MTDTPSTPKDPKPSEGTGVCLTPEEPTKSEPKAGTATESEAGSTSGSTSDQK
jgi:hypothetical protein